MFVNDLEKKILNARGISSESEIEQFLSPVFERDLHDSFLLPDMQKAIDRIEIALAENETIVIYADYDADGVPAGALLFRMFEQFGKEVEVYVPDRNKDGFGINKKAALELSLRANLVISVDCGSVDFEAAEIFKEKGVDLIITDHHHVQDSLPHALAHINPQRHDSKYPFKGLSGSGVAWKLAQAFIQTHGTHLAKGWEKWLLGYAAIGTVCDMMPMVDENRALVRSGLEVLKRLPWIGWKQLVRSAQVDIITLNETTLGFSIGPRINAASRMGSVQDIVKLLTTNSFDEALSKVKILEALNSSRKNLVKEIEEQAREYIKKYSLENNKVIVCGNEKWRPSLLGLVASSLAREYERPIFVWGKQDSELVKGSCRSGGLYSVFELMNECNETLFVHHGGHTHAGGFACQPEKVVLLQEELEASADKIHPLAQEEDKNIFNVQITHFTHEFLHFINSLRPFGLNNPEPVFKLSGKIDNMRTFGKEGQYYKAELNDGSGKLCIITFDKNMIITPGNAVIEGVFERNEFNGAVENRIKLTSFTLLD